MKKYPEKFLKKKFMKYEQDSRIKRYFEVEELDIYNVYSNVENKDIMKLFSLFHYIINDLFIYMNERTKRNLYYYTADESRSLIYIIEQINECQLYFKGTLYEFELLAYMEIFEYCSTFLEEYRGSQVPDDFKQIEIVEFEPIFRLKSAIEIVREDTKNYYYSEKIGEGSYAEVYKYYDTHYNRNFIIKRARDDLNTKEYERFKLEYLEMSKLNSPYVVEVYNYNEEKREYTMECLDETVYDYIKKNTNLKAKIELIKKIINAFKYLHSKELLHRDISPMNILLKKYDNGYVAKITDFGLVKVKESELTSLSSKIKGCLNDPKLSVYENGFQDYEMIHETYAFTRLICYILTDKINGIKKEKNKMLNEFIKKGISDDHKERYQNMNELESAFKKINFILK